MKEQHVGHMGSWLQAVPFAMHAIAASLIMGR